MPVRRRLSRKQHLRKRSKKQSRKQPRRKRTRKQSRKSLGSVHNISNHDIQLGRSAFLVGVKAFEDMAQRSGQNINLNKVLSPENTTKILKSHKLFKELGKDVQQGILKGLKERYEKNKSRTSGLIGGLQQAYHPDGAGEDGSDDEGHLHGQYAEDYYRFRDADRLTNRDLRNQNVFWQQLFMAMITVVCIVALTFYGYNPNPNNQ